MTLILRLLLSFWFVSNAHSAFAAESISPDGRFIATGEAEPLVGEKGKELEVYIWDVESRALVKKIKIETVRPAGSIQHIQYSPNGDFLFVSYGSCLEDGCRVSDRDTYFVYPVLVDLSDDKITALPRLVRACYFNNIYTSDFSSDGKTLIFGDECYKAGSTFNSLIYSIVEFQPTPKLVGSMRGMMHPFESKLPFARFHENGESLAVQMEDMTRYYRKVGPSWELEVYKTTPSRILDFFPDLEVGVRRFSRYSVGLEDMRSGSDLVEMWIGAYPWNAYILKENNGVLALDYYCDYYHWSNQGELLSTGDLDFCPRELLISDNGAYAMRRTGKPEDPGIELQKVWPTN